MEGEEKLPTGGEGKAQAAQRGRGDLLVVPARCSGAAG